MIMIGVSKEFCIEFNRYKEDKKANAITCKILDSSKKFVEKRFDEVKVGDLILLTDEKELPADCVVLKT
jgi:magnesium-transporting ATPase (P-type)